MADSPWKIVIGKRDESIPSLMGFDRRRVGCSVPWLRVPVCKSFVTWFCITLHATCRKWDMFRAVNGLIVMCPGPTRSCLVHMF